MGLADRIGVFLDRDGTLTLPYHHPTRPEHLVPSDGIVEPLRRLADVGVALVIVTNQSVLARGLLTGDGFAAAQSSFEGKLAEAGVHFDGVYHCPHHPDGVVAALAVRCGCRKPEPGMLLRAAAEHGVDLARSWMVGDQPSDVEAGRRAGCRTILIGQPGQRVTAAQALWTIADDVAAQMRIVRPAAGPARRRTVGPMLVSTAPLRISLAGGGTDLVAYASRHGGAVVGAATDLAVTVVRHRPPAGPRIRACLDHCDHTDDPSAVTNPFARAALLRHWDGDPVHLASFGDAVPGTGVGSSAAFCVALVAALDGDDRDPRAVAERASAIETDALGRPVGKQDHFLSALGGFQLLRFEREGTVHTEPVPVLPEVRDRLDEELLLFFTGKTRDAGTVLAGQHKAVRNGDRDVTDRLHDIKSLTEPMIDALRSGNLTEIGRLLDRHWRLKQGLSPAVSTPTVNAAYRAALDAGATGGKLAGAGGGGHLLLHVPVDRRTDVVAALAQHGATPVPVHLGGPGVRTVHLSPPTGSQASGSAP